MELEVRILLWLVITAATGVIGGLSWFIFKRILFLRDKPRLPSNGSKQEDEAWLLDLRRRVTELEMKRDAQDREMETQGQKILGLREQLFRLRKKWPEE